MDSRARPDDISHASTPKFKLDLGGNERTDDLSLILGFMPFGDNLVCRLGLKKKKEGKGRQLEVSVHVRLL